MRKNSWLTSELYTNVRTNCTIPLFSGTEQSMRGDEWEPGYVGYMTLDSTPGISLWAGFTLPAVMQVLTTSSKTSFVAPRGRTDLR